MNVQRTNSENPDFIELVGLLDADLAQRDGDDHAFYHQFNAIDNLRHVVVFYENSNAVGCGAFKAFDSDSVEIKRMYTRVNHRKKGIASQILAALELWAAELGFTKCVLETGIKQPEAIELYVKNGYTSIPNYGQYVGVSGSQCFEKML